MTAYAETVADWGWQDARRPNRVVFIKGTLAESYAAASRHRAVRLVTANPASLFHAVMDETEAAIAARNPTR